MLFTSDQGLAFGQRGFRGTKVAAYDANVCSPLIFSLPAAFRKTASASPPFSGVDLVATMLRFVNMPPPWEMHGRDLTPLLKGPDAK